MVRAVGDALADALMRPGGVVVLLVFGQDGSQVRFAENEAAVSQADREPGDAADRRRAAGLAPVARVVPPASRRCQASSVAGVTGRPRSSAAPG